MTGLNRVRRIVGLIPAAGRATRLAPLPCSKELLPVGYRTAGGVTRPKVVSHYLLEKMRTAGVDEVYVMMRSGKWDIPDYYGDGASFGLNMAYVMVHEPLGPPFTLDRAKPFVRDAIVLFGFPDILFEPGDAFTHALARLDHTNADMVVGVFPSHPDDLFDVIRADEAGRIQRLEIKEILSHESEPGRAWVFAVWRPSFTEFLRAETTRLRELVRTGAPEARTEWPVGSVIDAAIDAGMHVDSVYFPGAKYTDVGKPERLIESLDFPGVWNGRGRPPSNGQPEVDSG